MNIQAKDLIATFQTDKEILGHLFWFSVGTQMIKREELEQLLIGSGVGKDWMPNRIRVADAFRRATREIQKKKPTSQAGVYRNFLVREVYSNNEVVQRNIVSETVDQKDKKLNYETQSAVIRIDKKYGTLSFEADKDEVKELCKEVEEKFYLYRDHYSSQHLRSLIPKILGSLAPIPMRRNGTIYFVPHSMTEELKNLVTFINSLGESESHKVPVINSRENLDMMHKKIIDHLELLEQCENVEGLQKGQIKLLMEGAKQAIIDYENYKSIISSKQEVYEKKISKLEIQLESTIEEVRNLE